MVKWTQDHPIQTHLINLLITMVFIVICFYILKNMYGDKLNQIYDQTQVIYDVITNL